MKPRPDRPRHEAAAAVRANVTEALLDARRAEGAFVGADPRIRRQVGVAELAVRSQFEHSADTAPRDGMAAATAPPAQDAYLTPTPANASKNPRASNASPGAAPPTLSPSPRASLIAASTVIVPVTP